MSRAEFLIKDLPDPVSARRFLDEFTEKHPSSRRKTLKKRGPAFRRSDARLLQPPTRDDDPAESDSYIWWLEPKRARTPASATRKRLSESLARFSLTNSQLDTQVVLSRFRRRELLRIFLRDIRRLATIAEITEEISNLADAILEHALKARGPRNGKPLRHSRRKPTPAARRSLPGFA